MAASKKRSSKATDNDRGNVSLEAGDASVTAKAVALFPTTIWIFSASATCKEALPAMQTAANKLFEAQTSSAQQRSSRQSWRLDSPHQLKEFAVLNHDIQRNLSVVCKQLGWEPARRTFDSWLGVLPPGGHHVCHHHGPNLLSGVAYLDSIDADSGRLVFKDPRPGRSMFSNTQRGPVDVPVDAEAGSILIFPAWLEHSVEINNSTAIRRSLAFNLGSQLR